MCALWRRGVGCSLGLIGVGLGDRLAEGRWGRLRCRVCTRGWLIGVVKERGFEVRGGGVGRGGLPGRLRSRRLRRRGYWGK